MHPCVACPPEASIVPHLHHSDPSIGSRNRRDGGVHRQIVHDDYLAIVQQALGCSYAIGHAVIRIMCHDDNAQVHHGCRSLSKRACASAASTSAVNTKPLTLNSTTSVAEPTTSHVTHAVPPYTSQVRRDRTRALGRFK